MLHSQ
jgi:hypothetical protein